MIIQFVPREEIDKTKWNSCVHYAVNGNIFGYMWYLDNVAKEWDALVEDDYVSVMPLIGRIKYIGVKELYQPMLLRETGIYSINALSQKRVQHFLEAIPSEYKVQELHLNEHHQLQAVNFEKSSIQQAKNHQLFLNKSYEEIAAHYTPAVFRQLEKAKQAQLIPANNLKPEKIVDFYKKHTKEYRQLEQRYHAYLRIMYNVLHRGWGSPSVVLDGQKNILAVNFFIYSHSKATSLLFACSEEGRQKGADAFLYDTMIQAHAEKSLILDFNTKQDFPKEFGADATFYQQFRRDNRKWGIF